MIIIILRLNLFETSHNIEKSLNWWRANFLKPRLQQSTIMIRFIALKPRLTSAHDTGMHSDAAMRAWKRQGVVFPTFPTNSLNPLIDSLWLIENRFWFDLNLKKHLNVAEMHCFRWEAAKLAHRLNWRTLFFRKW